MKLTIDQNLKNFQAVSNKMIKACLVINPAKGTYHIFNQPNKMIN